MHGVLAPSNPGFATQDFETSVWLRQEELEQWDKHTKWREQIYLTF